MSEGAVFRRHHLPDRSNDTGVSIPMVAAQAKLDAHLEHLRAAIESLQRFARQATRPADGEDK